MARVRQIYQTDTVWCGPTGANSCTGAHFSADIYQTVKAPYGTFSGTNMVQELLRVQSSNYSFNKTLKDVNQFGELGAIDRIPIAPPTVSMSTTWLLSNLSNERIIGFTISTGSQVSAISGFLAQLTDTKNYFINSTSEGSDSVGSVEISPGSPEFTIAIGNASISSYSTAGSVGNFPTSTINVEGLNMNGDNAGSGRCIPAVNPVDGTAILGYFYALPTATQNLAGAAINSNTATISVLRPGDISFTLGLNSGDSFFQEADLKIQSYTINFNLTRQDLNKLGSKYAFAKVIQFPQAVTMQVQADAGEFSSGSLVEIINNNTSFNPKVQLKQAGTSAVIAEFQVRGAKLDSQAITSSIGPNKNISLTFSAQLAGPQSTNGLFLSGIN